MKVVFLDIDGVLNSRKYDRTRDWKKQDDIDETRLPLVAQIIAATGAEIVLSSTWRQHWDKDASKCDEDGAYINGLFAAHGLRIYDKTPYLGLFAARREEVQGWLDECGAEVERYVIIDDYRFDWGDMAERLVVTNPIFGEGLESEHVEKAVALLND